ncbi:MAG: hypothetical protein K0S56_404 [Microvirga sp.]|jgi:hypothetical protein|nr:hypothetical protein [Microvirga sp.]
MITTRPLFHSAPILLAPGSVVMPGNWGRLLRDRADQHSHWNREMALEEWRATHAPEKPSRLFACFACDCLPVAEFYVQHAVRTGSPRAVIYEVTKEDASAGEHRGDFNCVQPVAGLSMAEVARRYWSGAQPFRIEAHEHLDCWEIVTPSPLRILRRVG